LTEDDSVNPHLSLALSDQRLQRLLTVCQQINSIRSKISVATKYIEAADKAADTEDVVLAREALLRDLERDFAEATELLPIVDELVARFDEEKRSIDARERVHEGLAKIEDLSGEGGSTREHWVEAGKDKARIAELEDLIAALENLEKDLYMRKGVIFCPRCTSHEISYRIVPTELGFSLYRCNKCGNAWRTRQFSMRVGLPAQ